MAAPSYHLTSYTGTTNPAGDIITLIEVDLTAAGWTFVEQAAFTMGGTPRYMRVWKCPGTLNKAGTDFHIGLVRNQAAGTYFTARAFEGYNATNHTIQRPCIPGSSTLNPWGAGWNTKAMATSQASLGCVNAGGILFVGCNAAGVNVNTTTDGYTWANRVMPSTAIWRSFAYGNGTWIATSNTSGTAAAYSTDGSNWLASNALPSAAVWSYCAFGNGSLGNMFVAIPSNTASTAAASSPDGITWTARAMPVSGTWGPVAFGNGVFVALNRATGSTNVATSPDGQTWTNRPTALPSSNWLAITFGGGVFCAITNSLTVAATSTDGITWTQRTLPVAYDLIAYGNGMFVAVSSNGNSTGTSPDGAVWTARTPISNNVASLGFINGMFFGCQSSVSATIYMSPMDLTQPNHAGAGDWPLDNPGVNYPTYIDLLPTLSLVASTNYDVGVLVSKSYLVINVQPLGTTTMNLTWLLGLFDPIYSDSQATCPPLVAVDLRGVSSTVGNGVSRTPRVNLGPNAFGALVFPESVPFGIFPGAVAEAGSGTIRAARVGLGGAQGSNGFTGAGACYRGRLYDAIAVATGSASSLVKVGDSVTIGGTVYTALGSSPNPQAVVTGTSGWFFNTAAGS